MVDAGAISAVWTSLKFTKETLSLLLGLKIDNEAMQKVNEALHNLGEAQDTLFKFREEMFALQSENNRLKKELLAMEKWEETFSRYKLVKTEGGAMAYEYQEEPEHYACPHCVSKRAIEVLQDNKVMSGSFTCPGCKNQFYIKPEPPRTKINHSGGAYF